MIVLEVKNANAFPVNLDSAIWKTCVSLLIGAGQDLSLCARADSRVFYFEKVVKPIFSLKVTANFGNTSILPSSRGTSSTWLHATLA